MRVLWLSVTPSLYKEEKIGGWIASLENIVHKYAEKIIELGIAFETNEHAEFKVIKNNTIYYPIVRNSSMYSKIVSRMSIRKHWETLRSKLLRIIADFKPDIIHCFGSEWPYGAIVTDVTIPVVVHMQGFLNVYNLSQSMVVSRQDIKKTLGVNPVKIYHYLTANAYETGRVEFERELMAANHYFMGRTEWDMNICKYFSPGSKYFNVPEAIRPDIYDAATCWSYKEAPLRLTTITQAGYLKGNEIILRTAKILKDELGLHFEWRVAGNKDLFPLFENKTRIRAEDVNVKLLGMIDTTQIVEELSSSMFYIHPAIIDNSPNSLCEAQLIGCPVIAANVGGIPQLVDDGRTGFLYPYNEPYTLAFMICNLKNNKDRLIQISREEINNAKKRHDPKVISDRVISTYKDVIKDYKFHQASQKES